jgi:hypothetical protein
MQECSEFSLCVKNKLSLMLYRGHYLILIRYLPRNIILQATHCVSLQKPVRETNYHFTKRDRQGHRKFLHDEKEKGTRPMFHFIYHSRLKAR